MNRTTNTVNDRAGIVARLLVLAILLGVLSTVLQGCSSNNMGPTAVNNVEYQGLTSTAGNADGNGLLLRL